jgi:hypothetical protein
MERHPEFGCAAGIIGIVNISALAGDDVFGNLSDCLHLRDLRETRDQHS